MTPTTVSRLKAILSGSQFDSVMRILGDDQQPALYTKEEVKAICHAFGMWQVTVHALPNIECSFDRFWISEIVAYGDREDIGGKRFQKAAPVPPCAIGGDVLKWGEPAEKYWQDCHFVATLVGANSVMKEFYCHTMINPGPKSAYIDFLKDCSNYFYEKYKCDSTVIFTDVIKP